MKQALRINISDDLKSWVDAQAEDIGCDAATWIRMLVVAARKQGRVAMATPRVPAVPSPGAGGDCQPAAGNPDPLLSVFEDDAWRGPADEPAESSALDALIADKLASTALTPAAEPVEMFARTPQAAAASSVRTLARPPPRHQAPISFPQRAL